MKNYTINGFERKVGLYILLIVGLGFALNACMKEQSVGTPDCTDYTLTQADLDKASEFNVKSGIIGDTFDSLFYKSHDTMTTMYLSRDVFENLVARNDSVGTGAIYIRRSYAIPDTNHRDQRTLSKVMLMIKHCSGYFPDGGDWEYVNMKIDASVDTSIHPNGILPTTTLADNIADTSMAPVARGKLLNHCGTCHAKRNFMGFLFLDK